MLFAPQAATSTVLRGRHEVQSHRHGPWSTLTPLITETAHGQPRGK